MATAKRGDLDSNNAEFGEMVELREGGWVRIVGIATPSAIFSAVSGSPFLLSSEWEKVATVTADMRGLRIAPLANAAVFDIEWTAVPAGAAMPTDTYGEPVFGGEDFAGGFPLGDIYLKSASGQVAIVKTGS